VFAATLVLLALSGGLILAMLAMFMTGAAWEAMFVQKLTWIQHDAPKAIGAWSLADSRRPIEDPWSRPDRAGQGRRRARHGWTGFR